MTEIRGIDPITHSHL